MKIKKIIKYVFVGIVILLIVKIVIQELFDNRPFKFEKYKTSEQLAEAAKFKFLVGNDINQMKNELEKSGAECWTYKPSGQPINQAVVHECEYNTNLFSLHPLECYRLWLTGDDNYKLIEVGAQRVSGIWMYIP